MANEDIRETLLTQPKSAPNIVLFLQAEELTGTFIVGDGVISSVDTNIQGVYSAVIKLLATYYIFDLDFPREYAMAVL